MIHPDGLGRMVGTRENNGFVAYSQPNKKKILRCRKAEDNYELRHCIRD